MNKRNISIFAATFILLATTFVIAGATEARIENESKLAKEDCSCGVDDVESRLNNTSDAIKKEAKSEVKPVTSPAVKQVVKKDANKEVVNAASIDRNKEIKRPYSGNLTSRSSVIYRNARWVSGFEVTFYNDLGITRSGARTYHGITAAVDPNVIQLGSLIEIRLPDGTTVIRQAQDTGSAVKGRVVDIYVNRDDATLKRWGRIKGVNVRVIGKAAIPSHK